MPNGGGQVILFTGLISWVAWVLYKKFDKPIKTPEQIRRDLGYDNNDDDEDYFEYLKRTTRASHKINGNQLNRIQTMVNKATGEVIQNKQKFIDDFYS